MVVEMYLFSVDFSKKGLLTEQLNIESIYDLPIMNNLLFELQLINFADLPIEKAFLIGCEKNIDVSFFDTDTIKEQELFKILVSLNENETFIAYRNDFYFEFNCLLSIIADVKDLVCLIDKEKCPFAIMGLVGDFKKILNKNMSISDLFASLSKKCFYIKAEVDTYCKCLNSVNDYKKLLFDILDEKTIYKPPFVAEGVYIKGQIPKGDFSIIPPVYLGESVQIESGSVVGPNTIIYDNTLISENTSIKNSVLFENVFVSSNCFIDGTVCCDNASIKRNTAVFSGSVIGADALIGEDMTVENDSVINKNVRFDKFNFISQKSRKTFCFDNKFRGLSPDKTALLGSAVGVVFKKPKIIVGSDSSPNSLCLKLAFLSGLMASGCECFDVGTTFKSHMFFSSKFCECDYFVFFNGLGGGTDIEIYNSDNTPLNKTQYCNLFDFCNKGEFGYTGSAECKFVRQIRGMKRMYIREVTAFSDTDLPYISHIICGNPTLLKTLEEIFNICADKQKRLEEFELFMNEKGTNVNIKFGEDIYSQKLLQRLVFSYVNKQNKFRIFQSDLYNELWRYDSVILVMAVLNIIKSSGKNLDVLIKELPKFYIKNDSVNLQYRDSELAGKISKNFKFKHQSGAFNIKCKDGYIRLINDKEKGKVRVLVASKNMAISEEICNFFKGFLPQL